MADVVDLAASLSEPGEAFTAIRTGGTATKAFCATEWGGGDGASASTAATAAAGAIAEQVFAILVAGSIEQHWTKASCGVDGKMGPCSRYLVDPEDVQNVADFAAKYGGNPDTDTNKTAEHGRIVALLAAEHCS